VSITRTYNCIHGPQLTREEEGWTGAGRGAESRRKGKDREGEEGSDRIFSLGMPAKLVSRCLVWNTVGCPH